MITLLRGAQNECSVVYSPGMRFSSLTDHLKGFGAGRWAVHVKARQRKAAGDPIVMLSIGEPQVATPPGIIDRAAASMRAGRTKYAAGRGEPELLGVLAERYAKRSGRDISPDQVTFFPGSHTALYALCQALLEEGDEILVPEPFYAAYEGIIRASRATIVPVALLPEQGFHLQMGALDGAVSLRTRVLILNNPHNPTGAVLAPERVAEIAEFCERHDLWLISDEAYEHLVYEGTFASAFDLAQFAERTVVINSVSKSHSMTGWRCGWAVGSLELMERLVAVSEAMMFGAQPFLQDATAYALSHHFDECDQMFDDYQRRARLVTQLLEGSDAVQCHMPQGGIFVMADIRATGLTGEEFAWRLLDERDVATMPGESFGAAGGGHIRMALTATDHDLEVGCAQIVELAEALTG